MSQLLHEIVRGREQGRWVLFRWAAMIYATGTLLHTLDHFRRGLSVITPEVLWAGNISTPIAVLAMFLALVGWRGAPLLAVAFGYSHGIGIAIVHLAPHWSVFSDSLPSSNVSPVSYFAVLSEIIGAALFATAGLYVLLERKDLATERSMLSQA